MRTIVEPKEHINKLWGKQQIREGDTYRMMRYVLRVDHDDHVLLHNVVTGRLVVLESEEAEVVDKLPLKYDPAMEQLVAEHYLVPEGYDEHKQVICLRMVLRRINEVYKPKGVINQYTILPTTACNARCYYCFEQGCKSSTMSKQTADDLVNYIVEHCSEGRKIDLVWFGGEPTIATDRIDQICKGLIKANILFRSKMITNGYQFDKEMVKKAKDLWNLKMVQICFDGTENSYNRIKNYVAAKENPYYRVMRNVGILLDYNIAVSMRMNFDVGNYNEFEDLINEAILRFGHHKLLRISAHPVIGEYPDQDGQVLHGSDAWFTEKIEELRNLAKARRVASERFILPYMNYSSCEAYDDACLTIAPDGSIAKCPEQFDEENTVGHIQTGITNKERLASWQVIADYPICRSCVFFPNCLRLVNCKSQNVCFKREYCNSQCQEEIIKIFNGCS